ncbi:hypothetical protein BRADI_4g05360v3 [Brachypodium distachyon]|nr:hypothetical protein BRADI_4g05360v3 [Brachypodium distachyon]
MQVRGRTGTMEGGVFGFREIVGEEFMTMLLPFFGHMVQRVVSEEVEKAMFRHFHAQAAPPRLLIGRSQRPTYQLMFLNGLKPVYTMMKLEAKDGSALKVALVEKLENDQTRIVRSGHLCSVRVEVVVLHGNFNAKNEECWTPEEFSKHIVWGREKSRKLLTGDLTLKLSEGVASLENANFTDNSSFTSTKKFRLGLRLVNPSGERVLEGITDPFRVKERRVEGFEKHYPPLLHDEVWRLEKIGRNGAYHQALSNSGIDTVQKFLQSYVKNEQKLLQTFSKMSQAAWKRIIGHAMTCKVSNRLCLYEIKEKNMELFFDDIVQLVGVKFGDCYKPLDQLHQAEKNLVETLKQLAYQNMKDIQYAHRMINNYPEPLDNYHTKSVSGLSNVLSNQKMLNYGKYSLSQGDVPNSQGFEPIERFCSFQRGTDASEDMSRFLLGQSLNGFNHELVANNFIPYSSSQGISLPGPRITQLRIPNNGRRDFDPDSTRAVVHGNIQADQVAMQSGQYGFKQSHFTEESYSSLSVSSLSSMDTSLQPHFQLTSIRESFSNQPDLPCNGQTTMQPHQVVPCFQPSRTNSFDSAENDQLVQSFISQIFSSEGASMPLSPRKWVKIKAALKLASVGRLSRASRRGTHSPPVRPRFVPTV